MQQHVSAALWAIIIIVSRVNSAPAAKDDTNQSPNSVYDYGRFEEVYDQRQNGSENYKVNLNGVVLVYAPPESLLSTVALLDPGLFDGDYLEELENLVKPDNKPEVRPEVPSSSTTTSLPPTTAGQTNLAPGDETNARRHVAVKRRYRFPQFIRSLISRRRSE